ncbi:MAG: cellulase family glycosylhydrolase, partial [Clostridium sp.]
KNIEWIETEEEREILKNKFDIVKKYSMENKVPVFLCEFGVNKTVPDPYRWQWIKAVRDEADNYNFSWAYWEFCSDFGIYDLETRTWSTELRALIPF